MLIGNNVYLATLEL